MKKMRLSSAAWQRLLKKIGSSRSSIKWNVRLEYALYGIVHTGLSKLQDASYSDALQTILPHPPIFVLGFWRSGTTFLHELLCCNHKYGFPSTYACLNPSHFLLTENFAARRNSETSRSMDNMTYSWTSPQEDEFALLAAGAPSPYEALIFPSLIRDPRALVDFDAVGSEERQCWADSLRHFLRLLTLQQRKTIVFKSPPHGYKLELLREMFPNARYVIIDRNPYEVFASNLKLWRTLFGIYAVEPFNSNEIEQFVCDAYSIHERAIIRGSATIGAKQLAKVRYEDLIQDPIGQLNRVYKELDLGDFATTEASVKLYTEKNKDYVRNVFTLTRGQKDSIEKKWDKYIEQKKYSWPEGYVKLKN